MAMLPVFVARLTLKPIQPTYYIGTESLKKMVRKVVSKGGGGGAQTKFLHWLFESRGDSSPPSPLPPGFGAYDNLYNS